jgi:predicted site-specific integrase-resolvase
MQKPKRLYFLNDAEAAKMIGVSRQTLANWRHLRRGPVYIKQGRMVRYCQQDLLDFMLAGRIDPQSQLG